MNLDAEQGEQGAEARPGLGQASQPTADGAARGARGAVSPGGMPAA